MLFLAFILGNLLGFSLAYMIVAYLVKRSNDHGNSKGTFRDFNRNPLNVIKKRDRIGAPRL